MSILDDGDDLDRLQRDYDQQMAQLTTMNQKMAELKVEVTSPNGVVSVAVGSRGELTSLRLHGDKHRNMPGTELAALILKTITAAQAKLQEQITTLMPSSLIPGMDLTAMTKPDFDWSTMMGDLGKGLGGARFEGGGSRS
jgi:DNA-binding protein YbaB